ncbi:glycosyl hydrolase family 18 protein [Salinithrix halophila]|uniref:Glycosyl hydrolase family 18 protein n=1 Tax=Salinithrix halophila TaxID=1485204 RepID=A0ABV8JMF7_9BACL
MRNHFDLRPAKKSFNDEEPPATPRHFRRLPLWICLFFLLTLGGGGIWTLSAVMGKDPSDSMGKTKREGSTGEKSSGNEEWSLRLNPGEEEEEKDWWEPGGKTGEDLVSPKLNPLPKHTDRQGDTRQILHNNWRNPDLTRKPSIPATASVKTANHTPSSSAHSRQPKTVVPAPSSPAAQQNRKKLQFSVWFPWWKSEKTLKTFHSQKEQIQEVNFLGYDVTPDGNIRLKDGLKSVHPKAVRIAGKSGIRIMPVLGGDYSPSMLHKLLTHEKKRKALTKNILKQIVENGYDGIELQFQPLLQKDREEFSLFVEELATALHNQRKWLSVAVHPKTSEPGNYPAQKAQDWKRIGQAADSVKIMAWNYSWKHPGPSVTTQWIDQLLAFAKEQIPSKKIYLSLSSYGYIWPEEGKQFPLLHSQIPQWTAEGHATLNRQSGETCFVTRQSGREISGCVPNGTSLIDKVKQLQAKHPDIGGWSLWYLGAEDPDFWNGYGKKTLPPQKRKLKRW